MPTYEYECLPNKHRFEVKQSFTDDSLTECQVCGESVRKVFSAAGIVFKGSGYYVNDSRKAANGKAASKGSEDGSSAKDDSSSKSKDASTSDKESSSQGDGGSGSSSKAESSSGSKASKAE
ncbi:hypothetical protein BH24ACT15_BH24ACT15_18110 [soil metagenome]|jgi:putative FmdB family regulatory protein